VIEPREAASSSPGAGEVSTLSWLQQASDGRILQWEPHFLTEEVRMLGRGHLLDEPSFKSEEEAAGRLLELELTPTGLRLRTTGWTELQVQAFPRSLSAAPGDSCRRWRPIPSNLSWSDLPLGGVYDLTPRDDHGEDGSTRALLRPLAEPWLRFKFRFQHDLALSRIFVEPVDGEGVARFDRITLEALRPVTQGRLALLGAPVGLEAGRGRWDCDPNFQGFLAVVGTRNGQRYLLDSMILLDGALGERSRDPGEWLSLCKALGCESTSGPIWPELSQERLDALGKAAAEIGIPKNVVQAFPRGTLRFLVLRECGELTWPGEDAIRNLDGESSFKRVLEKHFPKVFPTLLRTSDSRARLWLLRNEQHPGIERIVSWVSRIDEADLGRAAELFPIRQRIEDLISKVRADSAIGQQAQALLARIDQALRSRAPLEAPEKEVDAWEKERTAEQRRPLSLDLVPTGLERFKAWETFRQKSRAWRRRVDQLLGFCENGQWSEPAGTGHESLSALAHRTGRLAVDLPLDSLDHPDDRDATIRLRQLVDEVLANAADEPGSEPRDRVIEYLSRYVQPWPERWSALHAALRRTGVLATSWPHLATTLALNADGRQQGARGPRVALFLKLIAELPAELARWGSRRSFRPGETITVEALLTTPGHPWIGLAHAEAIALSGRLAGVPRQPSVALTAPLRPTAMSPEGFLAWWHELRTLDSALEELRYQAHDLERHAKGALTLLRSLLAQAPDREGEEDLAGWLEKKPELLSHPEYMELLGVILKIEVIDG
jgi:hypothetical protein